MTEVTLTWYELELAAHVGVRRRLHSMREGRMERFHAESNAGWGDGWGRDIEGAAAEMAYAKARRQYWGGHVDTFREPDVAAVEIKHTVRDDGSLIVQPEEPDWTLLVLVTGRLPVLTIRGAMLAEYAKRPEWWRSNVPKPAFFVPQSALTVVI
jgi:hypothetical protein